MQKLKGMILYWLAAVVLGCGIAAFSYIHVNAEEIKGGEAYFTHTHAEACYGMVTKNCGGNHRCYYHSTEYKEGQCSFCGKQATLLHAWDMCTCPATGAKWEENGNVICIECGNICSQWGSPQGNHSYQAKEAVCGKEEGEPVAAVYITADGSWTNTGVTLTAHAQKLKDDSINEQITFDWEGASLYVEENGTYSVTASNSAGQTVSASFTVNCIDKTTPVIENVQGDTVTMSKSEIKVTVTAKDSESGLAGEAYSTDGGATWTGNSTFSVREGVTLNIVVRDNAENVAYKTLRRSDFPYPPEPPKPTEPEEPSKPAEPAKPPKPAETVKQPEKGNASKPSKGTKTEKTDAENSQMPPKESGTDELKGKDSKKKDVSDFTIARIPATKQGDNKTETVSEAQKGNGQRTEGAEAEAIKAQSGSLQDGQNEQDGQNRATQQTGEYIEHALFIAGIALLLVAILLFVRLLWLHSVVLYCYNGGEDYKRLGLLHLKKEKGRFFLYLPEYLLESSETPRYRLVLRQALIKRHENAEIVVQSAEHKLRRPVEECVDFVL